MKIKILIIGLILTLSSCFNPKENDIAKMNLVYSTMIVDSCEYIVFDSSYGDAVVHKGNCNNPNHNETKNGSK